MGYLNLSTNEARDHDGFSRGIARVTDYVWPTNFTQNVVMNLVFILK